MGVLPAAACSGQRVRWENSSPRSSFWRLCLVFWMPEIRGRKWDGGKGAEKKSELRRGLEGGRGGERARPLATALGFWVSGCWGWAVTNWQGISVTKYHCSEREGATAGTTKAARPGRVGKTKEKYLLTAPVTRLGVEAVRGRRKVECEKTMAGDGGGLGERKKLLGNFSVTLRRGVVGRSGETNLENRCALDSLKPGE